jgi:hypothetical protein
MEAGVVVLVALVALAAAVLGSASASAWALRHLRPLREQLAQQGRWLVEGRRQHEEVIAWLRRVEERVGKAERQLQQAKVEQEVAQRQQVMVAQGALATAVLEGQHRLAEPSLQLQPQLAATSRSLRRRVEVQQLRPNPQQAGQPKPRTPATTSPSRSKVHKPRQAK